MLTEFDDATDWFGKVDGGGVSMLSSTHLLSSNLLLLLLSLSLRLRDVFVPKFVMLIKEQSIVLGLNMDPSQADLYSRLHNFLFLFNTV